MSKPAIFIALLLSLLTSVYGENLVSVSMNGKSMPMPTGVLNFGFGSEGATGTVDVTVKNVSSRDLVLDAFSFGDNIKAVWKIDPPSPPPITRVRMLRGQAVDLAITLLFDDKVHQFPVVTISQGTLIATIEIGYTIINTLPEHRRFRTALPSGLGEWWSPNYHLCSGPALPHRALDPNSVVLEMFSENKDHPRSCGSWAKCSIVQKDNSDVCADTTIQGHHENDGSKDGHNEVLTIYLTLDSTYNFVPIEPAFEEVSRTESK